MSCYYKASLNQQLSDFDPNPVNISCSVIPNESSLKKNTEVFCIKAARHYRNTVLILVLESIVICFILLVFVIYRALRSHHVQSEPSTPILGQLSTLYRTRKGK